MKRKCKACGIEKDHIFLSLNNKARSVYKDGNGNLWNGRVCYECRKQEIIRKQKDQELRNSDIQRSHKVGEGSENIEDIS